MSDFTDNPGYFSRWNPTDYEVTLAEMRAFLPPDHPEVLAAMERLAIAYANIGRWDEALPIQEVVLDNYRSAQPESFHRFFAAYALSKTYTQIGRNHEAFALLEEALATYRAVSQDVSFAEFDDPMADAGEIVFYVMSELASRYVQLGRSGEALSLLEEATTSLFVRHFPDLDVAIAQSLQAGIYASLGRTDEAQALADEVEIYLFSAVILATRKDRTKWSLEWEDRHIKLMESMALTYATLGQLEQSQEWHDRIAELKGKLD